MKFLKAGLSLLQNKSLLRNKCEHEFPSKQEFIRMIKEIHGQVDSVGMAHRCSKCDRMIWENETGPRSEKGVKNEHARFY